MHRGLNGDPDSLHPHLYSSNDAATVLRDIGEGLITTTPDGRYVGGSASEWSISEDGRIYTFTLRENLKWSNGEELQADDYVKSFRKLVSPETGSPHASLMSPILHADDIIAGKMLAMDLGVKSDGNRLLQIELTEATPYFLQLLAHPAAFPIFSGSQPVQAENINTSSIVLSGAYKLESRNVGSTIRLVANDQYWGYSDTKVSSVLYHVVDQAVEARRYDAGDIHITDNVSKNAFTRYRLENPNELRVSPMLGLYFYGLNLSSEPFDIDPRIRKALSLAIDREVIVENILGRGEIPAYSIVPPGTLNYTGADIADQAASKTARIQLAKSLFAQAGVMPDSPLSFELRYSTGGGHKKIALAIQSMWKDSLGVNVELKAEEFKVFIQNVVARNETQAFRLGWTGDFNDPYAFLQLFESTNSSNLTGYSNDIVDELISNANGIADAKLRATLLSQAEKIVLDDSPIIPIYFYVSKHLVSPKVVGWTENVLDIHMSRHLSLAPPGEDFEAQPEF